MNTTLQHWIKLTSLENSLKDGRTRYALPEDLHYSQISEGQIVSWMIGEMDIPSGLGYGKSEDYFPFYISRPKTPCDYRCYYVNIDTLSRNFGMVSVLETTGNRHHVLLNIVSWQKFKEFDNANYREATKVWV